MHSFKFFVPMWVLLFAVACGDDEDIYSEEAFTGETRKFWALDDNNQSRLVEAELRAEGEHCKFWVEKGHFRSIGKQTMADLVSEYDYKIRPRLLEVFSVQGPIEEPQGGKVVAQNSLEWADHLGDGDGKLSILILDLGTGSDGKIVAGYFARNDLFHESSLKPPSRSNQSDMLYMNVHMGPNSVEFKITIAHEVQHLMNFVNGALLRKYPADWSWEGMVWDWFMSDVWLDEGLSEAAQYVYAGQHSQGRVDWFNEGGKLIAEGNNFFIWGERPAASLDEYATVYLFFQWLRLQSGGSNDIYRSISTSKHYDYNAVVEAMAGKGNYRDEPKLQWETLLKDWLLANLLTSQPAGSNISPKHRYGDPLLDGLKVHWYPKSQSEVALYPGEGVYSFSRTAKNHVSGGNIRYAGVDSAQGVVSDGASLANAALLTYNTNTKRFLLDKPMTDLLERGQISPDAPPAGSLAKSLAAGAHKARSSRLLPIGLWDMVGLKEHERRAAEEAAQSD